MQEKQTPSILKNRYYLYLTEFFSGVAVMAVELGASRLLAPYFSSSQIVWTIIIGTIMIAMALGNLYGGRSADKNPDPDRLYRRILIAAVWIAAIPLAGKYLIVLIAGILAVTVSVGFLIWAAFLSCMIIFVFPLFLLGTVTPSLVKFTTDSLDDNARVVGRLGACNTIGSILGTFLPTFVTIPAVGTAVTFLLFSGILLVLALVYFLSAHRGKKAVVTAAILFVVCSIFGHSGSFAFWDRNLTYEGESVYNYLQVKDGPDRTILSTNVLFGVQSVRMKSDSLTGMYYDYALAAPVMAGFADKTRANAASDGADSKAAGSTGTAEAELPSLLILGMGTGTFAEQTEKYFPGVRTTGVEIDDKITDLSHRYFDLPEDIPVATYDGRAYLQGTDEKFDVIMVDAYQDITIPFQMSSTEFFTEVKEHLAPGGVMVVNMNMWSDSGDSINAYLTDTICSVFPHVATVDVAGNTNRELFASVDLVPEEALAAGLSDVTDPELSELLTRAEGGLVVRGVSEDGQSKVREDHILTDDKAPVEVLGMRMIDDLIQNELTYYKKILREEGVEGILREL